ncbi:restriction endonuclease subunit S, partial [Limosilactobacillus reuteri subsp. suis]|uniref:restriction endonuclease subunit S n=1 Tax=Limosilactobacillus reuteri TaxID=1598 RepID=UPI003990EFF1
TGDVFDGSISGNETKIKDLPGQAKKSIELNDILFSEIRPKNKRFALVTGIDPKNYVVSTKLMVLRNKNNLVLDTNYLYFYLTSPLMLAYFQSEAESRSGTFPQITFRENVANIKIDLPPLIEQRKIVQRLSVVNDKVKLNNQINDNLIAISKAKWLDLLSSTSTTEVSMNKIAKITMGQSPKSSTYNTNNEGLPLLNGATDFRENINPQRWTSDPKRVVYPNSYIFGVRATIGLTTKVYQKYAIGRGTGAATPINIIYDEFLYFYLEDLFKFYSQTGSGSVYINISKKEFENYKIDVPKISFIEQFHSEINPLFNQIKNNKLQNITLLQIKNDMLNKYFQ